MNRDIWIHDCMYYVHSYVHVSTSAEYWMSINMEHKGHGPFSTIDRSFECEHEAFESSKVDSRMFPRQSRQPFTWEPEVFQCPRRDLEILEAPTSKQHTVLLLGNPSWSLMTRLQQTCKKQVAAANAPASQCTFRGWSACLRVDAMILKVSKKSKILYLVKVTCGDQWGAGIFSAQVMHYQQHDQKHHPNQQQHLYLHQHQRQHHHPNQQQHQHNLDRLWKLDRSFCFLYLPGQKKPHFGWWCMAQINTQRPSWVGIHTAIPFSLARESRPIDRCIFLGRRKGYCGIALVANPAYNGLIRLNGLMLVLEANPFQPERRWFLGFWNSVLQLPCIETAVDFATHLDPSLSWRFHSPADTITPFWGQRRWMLEHFSSGYLAFNGCQPANPAAESHEVWLYDHVCRNPRKGDVNGCVWPV